MSPPETGRCFFDLPDEYRDPARAAAAILPIPYDATSTWKKGAARGPAAILEASTQVELYDVETASEPYRHGIATLDELVFDGSPEALADEVAREVGEIVDRGQLPVVVGGDHSVSIGAIRAAADRFEGLSVLQIDAHADSRDSYEGSTHNHACVIARARELCPVVQVGIRSLDASELEAIDPDRVFWAHEMHRETGGSDPGGIGTGGGGPGVIETVRWHERAVELLGPDVYVTIDLDAFDPSIVPATGTPEPGGLSWYQVTDLLGAVTAARNVVGFDVVELLPQPGQHASDFLAAKLIYRFLAMTSAARRASG